MSKSKKKDHPVFRVIFDEPYVPTDAEEACIMYLGMSIETLAQKIRAGKYDHLRPKQADD